MSGVKVTLIGQLAWGARVAGQLLLCAKSPPLPIAEIAKATPPLLLSVIACALEVVATVCPAKLSDAGENDTAAMGRGSPVPDSFRL
jgi:hypothetical protein